MLLVLVESDNYLNFLPLTYTRPISEIKVGCLTVRERLAKYFKPDKILVSTRHYLIDFVKKRLKHSVYDPNKIDDDALFINSALILDSRLCEEILNKLERYGNSIALTYRGTILVAFLKSNKVRSLSLPDSIGNLAKLPTDNSLELPYCRILSYPWELITYLNDLIANDIASKIACIKDRVLGDLDNTVKIRGNDVFVGEGSLVEPYVTIDSRSGPVYIGEEVTIKSGASIEGPVYIGKRAQIMNNAIVRAYCYIGNECRVGGEIEATVLHSYVNKYHFSFLGHSYVGEWVNLGAGFTNSDLKDTYGTVKVNLRGEKVDTGLIKYGCIIGDYVKASIGSFIYTGKSVGIASHIHGYVLEDVPSFTIWAKSFGKEPVELEIDSAIKTQEVVMSRRGVKFTEEDEKLLRTLFNITSEERAKAGVKKGKVKLT